MSSFHIFDQYFQEGVAKGNKLGRTFDKKQFKELITFIKDIEKIRRDNPIEIAPLGAILGLAAALALHDGIHIVVDIEKIIEKIVAVKVEYHEKLEYLKIHIFYIHGPVITVNVRCGVKCSVNVEI